MSENCPSFNLTQLAAPSANVTSPAVPQLNLVTPALQGGLVVPQIPYVVMTLPPQPSATLCMFGGGGVQPFTGNAGVLALNGLSGIVNILGAGNVSVTLQGQNIVISGSVTGNVTQAQLDSLSGWAASAVNLGATGSYLYNLMTGISGAPVSVSGYITTGQADLRYYPLSTNPSGYVTGEYYTKDQIDSFFLFQNPLYFRSFLSDLTGHNSMTYGYPTGTLPTTGTFSSVLNGQYLTGFVSPSGQPGLNGFIQGTNIAGIHAFKTNANQKEVAIYYELFKYTGLMPYSVFATSDPSEPLSTIQIHEYITSFITGITLSPNDRLGINWYAQVQGAGHDPTVSLVWGDDTAAAEALPISAAILASTYYPLTNPSGFITTGQTGQFYPASNPQQYAKSGDLTATGALLSAVTVTGSATINQPDFSGIGGTLVLRSGNKVLVSGAGGITQAQLDSVSGFATGISGALQVQINALSGFLTGTNTTFTFLTAIPTGVDQFYIPLNGYTYPTAPVVNLTFETSGPNVQYYPSISGRATTGFWALFSDVVLEDGLYLDVFINGQTVSSNPLNFVTGIPTGVDSFCVSYGYTFAAVPRVNVTLETTASAVDYGVSVSGRTTSGVCFLFTDVVLESGLYLNVSAKI